MNAEPRDPETWLLGHQGPWATHLTSWPDFLTLRFPHLSLWQPYLFGAQTCPWHFLAAVSGSSLPKDKVQMPSAPPGLFLPTLASPSYPPCPQLPSSSR